MYITFKQLSIFLKLAKLGNYSDTAKVMHMSQSAVSRQIAELEGQYGQKLLERCQNRYKLTNGGKVLYQDAQTVMNKVDNLLFSVDEQNEILYHELSIAVAPALIEFLMPAMTAFRKKYPNFSLSFKTENRRFLSYYSEEEEQCDFHIMEEAENRNRLKNMKLGEDNLVLAFNKNHPLNNVRKLTEEHLADEFFLITETGSICTDITLRYVSKLKVQPSHQVFFNSFETMLLALKQNMGVAIVPKFIFALPEFKSQLSHKPLPMYAKKLPFFITVHKAMLKESQYMTFYRFLVQYFKA